MPEIYDPGGEEEASGETFIDAIKMQKAEAQAKVEEGYELGAGYSNPLEIVAYGNAQERLRSLTWLESLEASERTEGDKAFIRKLFIELNGPSGAEIASILTALEKEIEGLPEGDPDYHEAGKLRDNYRKRQMDKLRILIEAMKDQM